MHSVQEPASIVVRSETKLVTWLVAVMAGFFVLAAGVGAVVVAVRGFAWKDPITWGFLGFTGFAALLVLAAVSGVRTNRYYGRSQLTVSHLPGETERLFAGVIDCSARVALHHEVTIKLSEIEQTHNGQGELMEHTRWRQEARIHRTDFNESGGRCEIPLSVECPGEAQPGDTEEQWTTWQVVVEAKSLSPHYFATFTFSRSGDTVSQFKRFFRWGKD